MTDVVLRDLISVSQESDAVPELADLLEAMGDVKNGPAFDSELPHDLEQNFGFLVAERRRWLIEDQGSGLAAQGARDFQKLSLRSAQRLNGRMDIER